MLRNDVLNQPNESTEDEAVQQLSLLWLAVPLAVLALALIALRPGPNSNAGQDSPAIGKPAPRLDLIRLSPSSTLDRAEAVSQGKVTLIHFWGTWCGPCQKEYPHLSEMARRFQTSSRFRFVSVSCEGSRDETFAGLWEKTEKYFQSAGIKGSAFADPQAITRRSAAERLERRAMFFPTSIVVGPDGKISGVWEGYTPEAVFQIEVLIENLLKREA